MKNIIVPILLVVLFTGCMTTKYAHKSFDSQEIDRIVVLPFMDDRKNPNPKLNFTKLVSQANIMIPDFLKYQRKYRVALCSDIGNVSSYSVHDLPSRIVKSNSADSIDPESVDHEWVKQLGPSTERWVLVPVIEKITRTNLLLRLNATATVSMYLFDKQTGELWWEGTAKGLYTEGVLIYGLAQSMAGDHLEIIALAFASRECINTLPERTAPFYLPD